jgi:hypothetical protein
LGKVWVVVWVLVLGKVLVMVKETVIVAVTELVSNAVRY